MDPLIETYVSREGEIPVEPPVEPAPTGRRWLLIFMLITVFMIVFLN